MLKEFYADMRSYYKKNKWMKFEFYFRQPFGLLILILNIITTIIMNHNRAGYIAALAMTIELLIGIILLSLILARKKYSYPCLIVLLVIEGISTPIWRFSVVSVASAGIMLVLLIVYYRGRKDFFYKERVEIDKRKRNRIIISLLGGLLIALTLVLIMCIETQRYMEQPAKAISYIAFDSSNTWTMKQAEEKAKKWIAAVNEKDILEIQKIIEEMLVEQEEETEGLFHLKKTVFQAGVNQEKCNAVLSCINAEEQGMAYYSLARIGHYYDERTSGNHELKVMAEENENGIFVNFIHGKSKMELAFIDMNEIVGEEGKGNLQKLGFSEEEIVSLMSGIYTDEDVPFIKILSMVSDEEYSQVFRNDPDELSAYAQDALYGYVYVLMSNGFKYDSGLHIIEQDFGQLECFINKILLMRAGNKKEDHSGRYFKILEDVGEYRMNCIADQLRQNYDQKEVIISLLPEFAQNVQLYTLFNSLNYRLNERLENTVQIKELGLGYLDFGKRYGSDLLDVCFSYEDDFSGRKNGYVNIKKVVGNDILHLKISLYSDIPSEEIIQLVLYGDVIRCDTIENEEVMLMGVHDANAILKLAWLENEGLLSLAGVNKELLEEGIEDIRNRANEENIFKERQEYLYAQYLLLTGEVCTDANGNPCEIQTIDDIVSVYVMEAIDDLESDYSQWMNGFDYIKYDIIHSYYLEN